MIRAKREAVIKVAQDIKEIEEYVESRKGYMGYEDLEYTVNQKLLPVAAFAKEWSIPFYADSSSILEKMGVSESSYEEESSSYYEEDYEESEYETSDYN